MSDEIQLRESKIVEQTPLGTKSVQDEAFDDVLNKDGEIEVELNKKVITERISKDLYKNAQSGLRELLMNSFRACRIAMTEHGEKNPHIIVQYDSPQRTLTIHDINAQGISKERFKKVLLVLGNSDNLNTGETGQFGMGFASYTTLSSTVLLQTKYRTEDGEGSDYAMLGRDGVSFKQVKMPALENYGTKLTLQLHNEISLGELHEMMEMAKTASSLQNIDCRVGIDSDVEQIEKVTLEDMVKQAVGNNSTLDIYSGVENEIEYTLAFTNYQNNSQRLFLGGAPITIEEDLAMCGAVGYFNVLNEGRYKPMPERERFTKDAETKIVGIVENVIMQKIIDQSEIPKDLSTIMEYEHKSLINRLMYENNKLEKYAKPLADQLSEINDVRIEYTEAKSKKVSKTNLVESILNFEGRMFKSQIFTQRNKTAIEDAFPSENIRYVKDKDIPEVIRHQIPTIADYIRENNLKAPKPEAIPTQAVLHSHFGDNGYLTTNYENRNTSKTIVMAESGKILDVISELKNKRSDYYFVKNYHVFEDFSIDWEEYLDAVKSQKSKFADESKTYDQLVNEGYFVFKILAYSDEIEKSTKEAMWRRKYVGIKNSFDFENAYPTQSLPAFADDDFVEELTDSELSNSDYIEYMFEAQTPLEKQFVVSLSRTAYSYGSKTRMIKKQFPKDIRGLEINKWTLVNLARLCDKYKNRPDEIEDMNIKNYTGEIVSDGMKHLFRQFFEKNDETEALNHLLTNNTAQLCTLASGRITLLLESGVEFNIPDSTKLLAGDMEIVSVTPHKTQHTEVVIKWDMFHND